MDSQILGDGVYVGVPIMIDDIDTAKMDGLDWVCYQHLVSWAALVFLWALGVSEFVTLSSYHNYR